jgi:hypothetical protein
MPNTSLFWRPDFSVNLADGWDTEGAVAPHDAPRRVDGYDDQRLREVRGGLCARRRAERRQPRRADTAAAADHDAQPVPDVPARAAGFTPNAPQ